MDHKHYQRWFTNLREKTACAYFYAFIVLNGHELSISYCASSLWLAKVWVSPLGLVGTHFKDTLAEHILQTRGLNRARRRTVSFYSFSMALSPSLNLLPHRWRSRWSCRVCSCPPSSSLPCLALPQKSGYRCPLLSQKKMRAQKVESPPAPVSEGGL